MSDKPAKVLKRSLSRWVDTVRRAALWIVLLAGLLTVLGFQYTVVNLGMNTDTADMISQDLDWRRTYIEYKELFPQYVDTLLLVVDGETPDLAAEGSKRLAKRLEQERDLVQWVYRPGGGAYFEEHALLYMELPELEELADNLASIQPFLGRLTRDGSLHGLFTLIQEALDAVQDGEALDLRPVLDQISDGVEAALEGRFHRLSWQELMLGREGSPGEKRRFVIVKPRLDYSDLLPAGPVMARIRSLAQDLGLTQRRGVQVRITGGTALSHEELLSVSRGASVAGVAALVLVGLVLMLGLRSLRLVLASLIALVMGLVWTAAFAALAIGHLNLISVAFAVLYIGLGVAYAIHFCLRYRELRLEGQDHASALRTGAGDVGGALVLCAVTTGIGFYAFIPTEYAGVSELGLIAGTGMFIGLGTSLTVLPALLTLMPLPPNHGDPPASGVAVTALASALQRYRKSILAGAAALGLAALALLPLARFDYNPLNLRDPDTESVSTYLDLMTDSGTSPWSMVAVAKDRSHAEKLKARLSAVPLVDGAASLTDFIPEDQDEKLALVEEIALLLGPELQSGRRAQPSVAAQRKALRGLLARLRVFQAPDGQGSLDASVQRLGAFLHQIEQRLEEEPASQSDLLARLHAVLLGALPEQLRMLEAALNADYVTLEDLPKDLKDRWVAADGRHRVEIFPKEDLNDTEVLRRFVDAVRAVVPEATDSPVTILESGEAVVRAFKEAFLWALGLITVLLFLLLRRKQDVALVLAPLLLGALLTVSGMVLLDIPFNFANVIALPLLLGVGVDNGIHMVNRARSAPPRSGNILMTSTARAVIIAAVTTICSFGNLALSDHRGTASMGQLLTIGLTVILVCTLIVLPVMLASSAGDSARGRITA